MEQKITIDGNLIKILNQHYNDKEYFSCDAIRDIKALFEQPALTPCVNPRVGQKVWVEMEVESTYTTGCWLTDVHKNGARAAFDHKSMFAFPNSIESPSTRLATMLKNPDDLNEALELLKQINQTK